MQKELVIFGLCFFLLIGFVSAVPYVPGELDSEFTSIQEKDVLNLQDEDGRDFSLSFLEFKWNEEDIEKILEVPYFTDNGQDGLLLDGMIIVEDISYKEHFWGCIDGAKFSDKFKYFFQALFGTLKLNFEEEQEFEAEGRLIEDTSGTGAYNSKECYEVCLQSYKQNLMKKDYVDCTNDCVSQFNCGTEKIWNSITSDGDVGLEAVYLEFVSEGKKEIFGLGLGINPDTEIIEDLSLFSIDPEKAGVSIDGFKGVKKKSPLNILENTKSIISWRNLENIEKGDVKFESLYVENP